MQLLKDFAPNAKLHLHGNLKTIRIEWLKLWMDLQQFQTITGAMLEAIQTTKATSIIVDQYNSSSMFPDEIQQFIDKNLHDAVRNAGIKNLLTIVPHSEGFSKISMKRWSNTVEQKGDFTMVDFQNNGECMQWLEENRFAHLQS